MSSHGPNRIAAPAPSVAEVDVTSPIAAHAEQHRRVGKTVAKADEILATINALEGTQDVVSKNSAPAKPDADAASRLDAIDKRLNSVAETLKSRKQEPMQLELFGIDQAGGDWTSKNAGVKFNYYNDADAKEAAPVEAGLLGGRRRQETPAPAKSGSGDSRAARESAPVRDESAPLRPSAEALRGESVEPGARERVDDFFSGRPDSDTPTSPDPPVRYFDDEYDPFASSARLPVEPARANNSRGNSGSGPRLAERRPAADPLQSAAERRVTPEPARRTDGSREGRIPPVAAGESSGDRSDGSGLSEGEPWYRAHIPPVGEGARGTAGDTSAPQEPRRRPADSGERAARPERKKGSIRRKLLGGLAVAVAAVGIGLTVNALLDDDKPQQQETVQIAERAPDMKLTETEMGDYFSRPGDTVFGGYKAENGGNEAATMEALNHDARIAEDTQKVERYYPGSLDVTGAPAWALVATEEGQPVVINADTTNPEKIAKILASTEGSKMTLANPGDVEESDHS